MTKIGITGSKGLLGQLLIKKLSKNKEKFTEFKGDISKKIHIKKWLSYNKYITHIFHFAAISHPNYNNKKTYNVNFLGTKNIIDIVKKKKIWLFFASTSHVYKKKLGKIKETDEIKPQNYYGKTKAAAEKILIRNKSKYFKICIGRIFSVYHKNQKKPFLYPSIKESIKKNKKKYIYIKNGNSIKDFSNANNIINLIYKIYKNKLIGVYNIGSGQGMSVIDFLNKKIKTNKIFISNKNKEYTVADITKIKNKLK